MGAATGENIAGNAYDKYHSANPIARHLMRGFLDAFDSLVERVGPATAFEIGCGEGHLSARLLARGIDSHGCDLDAGIVDQANAGSIGQGHGRRFACRSIYDFSPGEIEADLLVCCEVLEHLPDPERAIEVLAAQRAGRLILSVPREPVWRMLNLCRGKYIPALGNTPGHIQHWSSVAIRDLVESRFDIVAVRQPLPWTMLLCAPR